MAMGVMPANGNPPKRAARQPMRLSGGAGAHPPGHLDARSSLHMEDAGSASVTPASSKESSLTAAMKHSARTPLIHLPDDIHQY
jgi:hypothetical protein